MTAVEVKKKLTQHFKLANLDGGDLGRPAIVVQERIFDLEIVDNSVDRTSATLNMALPNTTRALIEQYESCRERLVEIATAISTNKATEGERTKITFRPPVLYPWNLVAVAVNYRAHGEEMNRELDDNYVKDPPYLFTKSPRACLLATEEPLTLPKGRTMIDWELELAAIIGKKARNVTRECAKDYIWGYGLILDISDRQMLGRDNAFFNVDWFNAKTRDGFAPMGPFIVPAEFVPNHANLHMELSVNEKVMQDYSTKYMNHNVEELVDFITSIQTLEAGDVIATGTPPGVGKGRKPPVFLEAGDVIRAEIEDICSITTPIV